MKAIYVCQLCGFQSEQVGVTSAEEREHHRPNQLIVAAATGWEVSSLDPGALLVATTAGRTCLYRLDHRVTEQEITNSATQWLWRPGVNAGMIE